MKFIVESMRFSYLNSTRKKIKNYCPWRKIVKNYPCLNTFGFEMSEVDGVAYIHIEDLEQLMKFVETIGEDIIITHNNEGTYIIEIYDL